MLTATPYITLCYHSDGVCGECFHITSSAFPTTTLGLEAVTDIVREA